MKIKELTDLQLYEKITHNKKILSGKTSQNFIPQDIIQREQNLLLLEAGIRWYNRQKEENK